LRDFSKHGEKAIAEVRRRQPAAYLKVCALLVPREHKVEHTNAYEGPSTEQIQAYIAVIQDRLDRRAAGDQAKVIDGEAVETSAVATTTPLVVLEPRKRRPNSTQAWWSESAALSKTSKTSQASRSPIGSGGAARMLVRFQIKTTPEAGENSVIVARMITTSPASGCATAGT
jgi:hypothetical protein